jgi:hypothetical protein
VWRVARPARSADTRRRGERKRAVLIYQNLYRQLSSRLADGRSAWPDRPAGSAEVDAGRYRNGHDYGIRLKLLSVYFAIWAAYCRGTKDLVYKGYDLRRGPGLVV